MTFTPLLSSKSLSSKSEPFVYLDSFHLYNNPDLTILDGGWAWPIFCNGILYTLCYPKCTVNCVVNVSNIHRRVQIVNSMIHYPILLEFSYYNNPDIHSEFGTLTGFLIDPLRVKL